MTYKSRKTASQQLTGIGFVVGLHLVGIYVVASGLAHQAVETVMGPIETKVIEEAKPKQEELPPPPPKLQTPPPYVPPPDLDVAIEAPPPAPGPSTAIATVTNTKPVAAPAPAPVPDQEAKLDPKGRRNSLPQDEYPRNELRNCHQGEALVSFLILANGRIGDSRIEKSTGYSALEEWGIKYAKANWRFVPATKEGQPIDTWKAMKLSFRIDRGC